MRSDVLVKLELLDNKHGTVALLVHVHVASFLVVLVLVPNAILRSNGTGMD